MDHFWKAEWNTFVEILITIYIFDTDNKTIEYEILKAIYKKQEVIIQCITIRIWGEKKKQTKH